MPFCFPGDPGGVRLPRMRSSAARSSSARRPGYSCATPAITWSLPRNPGRDPHLQCLPRCLPTGAPLTPAARQVIVDGEIGGMSTFGFNARMLIVVVAPRSTRRKVRAGLFSSGHVDRAPRRASRCLLRYADADTCHVRSYLRYYRVLSSEPARLREQGRYH